MFLVECSAFCVVFSRLKLIAKDCKRIRPRSVLGSFSVVLMPCKANFHVVRSAFVMTNRYEQFYSKSE